VTVCSDIADYEWLTGDEACALLDDLANDTAPLHTAVATLRRRLSPERTHLLVEQVELRRRATAKFTQAARLFFTRIGLEQATDEWVAGYKAERSAGCAVADLCCGIGGDLSALAVQGSTVGIDCNPIAAHFAAINTGAVVHTANVLDYDLNGITAWHIDPDRRPNGRRTTALELCQPNLAAIDRLLAQVPHAAVKLAPATKVPDRWADRCELEWISRDRECRQLVAWHGDLARSVGRRRATILPTVCDSTPRTLIGLPHQPVPIRDDVDRYIFDIDPAVLAAGLIGTVALEHGLFALGSGPTYLTGPRPIDDAALACFEVVDMLPLQSRQLAAHLRERGIGQLEIKKRGIGIDPEKLRRDLKLRGDNRATLLITPIAGRPTVIVAHRVYPPTRPIKPLLESNASRSIRQ
jgi:hypothetical protein